MSMLHPIPLDKVKPSSYQSRQTRFIDQGFQLKYTFFVTSVVLTCLLGVFGLGFYFLHENYKIFTDLAYEHSPNMVNHLEREFSGLILLACGTLLATCCFFATLGVKVTANIIAPIKILTNHLRNLSRGRWFERPITIRDADEFHDLVDAYNYFYLSFQKAISRDLDKLQRIHVDPLDKDSYLAIRELIQEKQNQLNISDEPAEVTPLKKEAPDKSQRAIA